MCTTEVRRQWGARERSAWRARRWLMGTRTLGADGAHFRELVLFKDHLPSAFVWFARVAASSVAARTVPRAPNNRQTC